MPLAFAPFDLMPIAFLGPALLFYLWLQCQPRRAFVYGYLFGVGLFGTGVWWVYVSMNQFGGVSLPVSVFVTGLFILFLALFPALVGWVFSRFFGTQPYTLNLIVVLPALWTLSEWVRGWIFTGFPWLALGYSQVDGPLRGFAPVFGVYGVSWLIVLGSGVLVCLIQQDRRRRIYGLSALVVLFGCGGLLALVNWTEPTGRPLQVTLLQGNKSQDIKWLATQLRPTINLYTELTRANWGSDIIIWPETALPAFYHKAQTFLAGLGVEARANHSDILIGLPVKDLVTGRYYNSMVVVGGVPGFYHKQHLVPFGEYIPFGYLVGDLMKIFEVPLPNFSFPDRPQPLLTAAGHKIGVSICYEDAFGEELIRVLPEATVLVNVSNDAWFGDSVAPHQHLQIARMRAIEGGRPMLRATNTGVTATIDHRGRIQRIAPQFEVTALTDKVQPMTGRTPYVVVGNTLVIGLLLAGLGTVVFLGRRSGKSN